MITSLFFKLAEMLGFSIIPTYTNTSPSKENRYYLSRELAIINNYWDF